MMRTRCPVLVLALAALVILAGCSGGATGPGGPQSPVSSPTATATGGATTPSGTLEIHFINVGQAESTLIVAPSGETMLVDTGDFTTDGEHVLAYLKRHDIERIDHLVTSHADADHIGGHAAIIDYYETEADGIGVVYDPGIAASTQTYADYLDAVERHEVTLYETREGDSIPFGGDAVDVQVLGPPNPYIDSEERNENSLVLRISFGTTRFLFTGDAAEDQEAYLVEQYGDRLRATVLKAGHHGSSSSTSGPLLDAVRPRAVVISSAYDSRYGHPHEATLQRLAERSIPTYWTATHGTVVLVSDGRTVSVRTQQAAPTDPVNLRSGDPIAPGTTGGVTERAQLAGVREDAPTPIPDGGTTSAPSLAIAAIHADAAGNDNDNLNEEFVVLENTGETTVDLSGWTLSDAAGHTYTFPDGVTLAPGAHVTVHTGSGTDTEQALHWDQDRAVWNNDGDTVVVRTADGTIVLEEDY